MFTDDGDNQRTQIEAQKLRAQGHILTIGKNLPKYLTHEGKSMNQKHEIWQDQGYWLLLPLLLLAALSFRRGWLGVLLLCVIGAPQSAYALSWHDLWQRPDQQAAKILAQGIAHYKAGEYDEAAAAFSKVGTARYNLGNSLAHLGEYDEAITAYEAVLKKNPQHVAAKHNLGIVKKLLEQQQSRQNHQSANPKKGKKEPRSGPTEQKETPKESIKGEGPVKNGQMTTEGKDGQVEGDQPNPDQQLPKHTAENDQLLKQWLKNVEGDLGELLDKKFQYQAKTSTTN